MAFQNTPPLKRSRTGGPQMRPPQFSQSRPSVPRGMMPPQMFPPPATPHPWPPQQQRLPPLPPPPATYQHPWPPQQQRLPPLPAAQAQPPLHAHSPALTIPQARQGFSQQPHAQRHPSAAVGTGVATGSSTTQLSTTVVATATGSLTVMVDSKKKKLILGQDQTMINWIMSQSGTSIKMLSSDATETTFQIKGEPQCTQKAKLLMDTALIENREYINRGHPGNPPKRIPGYAYDGSKPPT